MGGPIGVTIDGGAGLWTNHQPRSSGADRRGSKGTLGKGEERGPKGSEDRRFSIGDSPGYAGFSSYWKLQASRIDDSRLAPGIFDQIAALKHRYQLNKLLFCKFEHSRILVDRIL